MGSDKNSYRRFVDVEDQIRSANGNVTPEARQKWLATMHDALSEAHRPNDPRPLEPEMAFRLKTEINRLMNGHSSDFLAPVTFGPGSPGRDPDATECIRDAVRYARTCKAGLIADASFRKTIWREYGGELAGGLSMDTVKSWLASPKFKDVEPGQDPDLVTRLMRFSGKHYVENHLNHTKWFGNLVGGS